jgi:hypothetical protein
LWAKPGIMRFGAFGRWLKIAIEVEKDDE